MANSLEDLERQLQNIRKETKLAREEINKLNAAVKEQFKANVTAGMRPVLQGMATGGTPTNKGLDRLINEYLEDQFTGWRRAGGNSRVFFGKGLTTKLNDIINKAANDALDSFRKAMEVEDFDVANVVAAKKGKVSVFTGKATEKEAYDQTATTAAQAAKADAEAKRQKREAMREKFGGVQEEVDRMRQVEVLKQSIARTDKEAAAASRTKYEQEMRDSSGLAKNLDQQRIIEDYLAKAEKDKATASRAAATKKLQDLDAINRESQQLLKLEKQIAAQDAAEARKPPTAENLQATMGDYRSQRLLQQAQRYNFKPEDIRQIYTQQPSGVTVAKFEKFDEATKAYQRLEVSVDKFGNTINRTNKRLLGFTDSIIRNTQEVLKWSIGVGLIYGSMYKLQALIRLAIENEAKLADIAVILGDAQRDVNQIFDEAAQVAYETGESINGVLETYTLAYRAVGAIKDPVERANSAIQLLTDATVLNKLSSLDSATAIDVLAGSLRQLQKPGEDMGQAFTRGRDLLDAWVTVTRKANVDLATLATAFSITSESAENSGVSIEQLNAIIASLAEKIGGLGGRETGNAVRALIGGVYQQQAAEILTRYGIAVQDTAGRMRPFLDISEEIYTLYKGGIISADELNKIGYTLGGGVRRGQQYVAFLSDFERIQELANEQTNRGGAAQEALGRKVETTQTAITRLSNAFQSLAQTLGTDGGLLDTFGGILEIATKLVDAFDKLTGILGNITIPATLLGITALIFRGGAGQLKQQAWAQNVGGALQGITGAAMGVVPSYRQPRQISTSEGLITTTRANEIGRQVGLSFGKYASNAIFAVLPAAMHAFQGDLPGAGVVLAGGMVGALTGSPVGAMIGAVIAETFLEVVRRNQPTFEDYFEKLNVPEPLPTEGLNLGMKGVRKMTVEEQQQALISKNVPFGAGLDMAMQAWLNKNILGMTSPSRIDPLQMIIDKYIPKETQTKIVELGQKNVPVPVSAETTAASQIEAKRLQMIKDEAELVDEIITTRNKEIKIKSATGEITPKEQLEAQKTLMGLDAALSKLTTAFGTSFDKINDTISGTEDVYNTFANVLLRSSEEQSQSLINAATEWVGLAAAIEVARASQQNFILDSQGNKVLIEGRGGAQEQLDELQRMWTDYIDLLNKEQEIGAVKIPEIVNVDELEIKTKAKLEEWLKGARDLETEYFDAGIRDGIFTPAQVEYIKSTADDMWAYIGHHGGEIVGYQLIEGITDSRFLTEYANIMEEAASKVDLGFQTFDVTNPQLAQIVDRANAMASVWEQKYGYTPDITEELAITMKDNVVEPMKADWKIVQLLLSQIEENTSELEGIYNLPEGAGFYVPYQTLNLAYQKGLNEGQGAGGALAEEAFTYKGEGTTEALRQTTQTQQLISDMVRGNATQLAKTTAQIYKTYLPQITTPKTEYAGQKFPGYTAPKFSGKPRFDEEMMPETWADKIKDAIMGPNPNIPDIWKAIQNITGEGEGVNLKSLFDSVSSNINNTIAMNLNSVSTIQLVVDGRVLADIVKTYLYQDTVAFEGSGGTINRTLVI